MKKLLHPAEEICQVMAKIYEKGLTTVSGGNLSLRDEEGNIWVSPSGGDKADLKKEQICRILNSGEAVGPAKPSLEFKIHKGIFDRRTDIQSILHAHSPALVAMSIMHQLPNVKILPGLYDMLGELQMAAYAPPGSEALVENVASVFAGGCDTVILENHGIFIGSRGDLLDAYKKFEALDMAARIEMMARTLKGTPAECLSKEQIEKYKMLQEVSYASLEECSGTKQEMLLRQSVCSLTARAYRKGIFGVTQGTFSARLPEGGMVITPADPDNSCLREEELVKVKGDACEAGKVPGIMAKLHNLIYEKCQDIQSVITTVSPYAGTFVVTGKPYDVRVIPECFLWLRSCKTFDFDTFLYHPEVIAEYLSLETPAAIVKNGFFIICSVSPFAAYDRAEIFEYTARSIHYTRTMQKEIVNISEEEIKVLKENFALPKPENVKM